MGLARNRAAAGLALFLLAAAPAPAIQIEDLPPGADLQIREITIEGSDAFSEGELAAELLTQERAWYTPWRSRPIFEPPTFETDLERLRRFYETRGYYEVSITYELAVEGEFVDVKLQVRENEPIPVGDVEVGVKAPEQPPLPETLPIERGEIFTEKDYQQSAARLSEFFLERSYAHVEVERSAEIDILRREARVKYLVTPGPLTAFGDSTVEGTEDVDPEIVTREIEWVRDTPFSLEDIRLTRENLLALRLFSSVRIGWERQGDPEVVPMTIEVKERPPRELKVGVGYSTEDQVRAQLNWAHYNWLGGGRQLSLGLKYSFVQSSAQALFVQPHFPTRRTRGVLEFRQDSEDEDTYLLFASRFRPRFEHLFTREITGSLGWRAEFAKLNDIEPETEAVLGPLRDEGFLGGPTAGLVWDTTTDPLNPKDGFVISTFADHSGDVWGSDFSFYRVVGEAKGYRPIGWETTLAGRVKVGVADSIGGDGDFPIFERFYAGGEKSVRGYNRRRLGPISAKDEPLGGLSLVEGSLELRRPIWQAIGGAVFLDFGQLSLDAYDVPIGDLDFSVGPGISYDTPVGPLRLDVGFPFDPPANDSLFAVHFSIGAFF